MSPWGNSAGCSGWHLREDFQPPLVIAAFAFEAALQEKRRQFLPALSISAIFSRRN
jgi:hypothetical protein